MDPMTELSMARQRIADLHREADRERLANIARETRRANVNATAIGAHDLDQYPSTTTLLGGSPRLSRSTCS